MPETYEVDSEFAHHSQYVQQNLHKEAQRLGQSFCNTLIDAFGKLKAGTFFHGQGIRLNVPVLVKITVAFWEDILRIQTFHPLRHADRHKMAAHLFKWISRLRPIICTGTPSSPDWKSLTKANSIFAVICSLAFIKCAIRYGAEIQHMLYTSEFRDIQPYEWSIIFHLIEKAYPPSPNTAV